MDKNLVYLVQTDTTVGFVSADKKRLNIIKKRSLEKEILQVVKNFKVLQQHTRVPSRYKKFIRNLKNTTIIYPDGMAYRVVDKNSKHYEFIKKFDILYSTSANKTGKDFDMQYATSCADVVLYTQEGFRQLNASQIYKINNKKIKRIR